MTGHRPRNWANVILVVLGALLLSGCGGPSVSGTRSQPQASRSSTSSAAPSGGTGASNHTIIIPNNDLFAPYIAQLNVGDTVTWVNEDTVLHTILTSPTAQGHAVNPEQFQFVLGPGKSASITLRQPGLYYYYCDAHAMLPDDGPAAAHNGVRAYPMPMDGFLYVLGSGISATANETVAISSNNQFTPWLTIINPGSVVTWKNQTPQAMNVRGVPGYGLLNPTPLDFNVAPNSSSSVTFQTVGIYDYYSTESATLDSVWRRPVALPGARGYPVAMEGIVAVFP
jgi:plastocyanin